MEPRWHQGIEATGLLVLLWNDGFVSLAYLPLNRPSFLTLYGL